MEFLFLFLCSDEKNENFFESKPGRKIVPVPQKSMELNNGLFFLQTEFASLYIRP